MARPSVKRIAKLALVTADLAAAEDFFIETFDCELIGHTDADDAYATLLGLPQTQVRKALLALGEQQIELLVFDPPGRAYPAGSTSSDLWFQHFAIIVSDMAAAMKRLQQSSRFAPISEGGVQHLPPDSGSVSAFKFRDAEGHPLEFLAFPQGGGPDVWEAKRGKSLFLGIDHSAIAVADTAASVAFFEKGFGLKLAMQQENKGPEQARMDAVPEARVTVTGLAPERAPPHVELLGYKVGDRRPIQSGTRSSDLAATHFVMETDDIATIVEALTALRATFVSPGIVNQRDGARAIMVLDPDGHRFLVSQPA